MKDDKFRDSIATVTEEGKRKWIYPKKPSGRYYSARTIVSILLLAFFILIPFIKVNGKPWMLFDVLNRNFIVFGLPFGPHDFFIFVLTMIAVIVFIFLFTAIFGRLFCGWVCPQTVFMEMVFRKIEYWIEGDAHKQKQLNLAPWTGRKLLKKSLKHSIFFAVSFFIANILLAWVIGVDELIVIVTDPPDQHIAGLIAILIFTGIFYWIFSYFREQACTIVCPYGRLQGVLLDPDSMVIAYDYKRGEPRGKIRKNDFQSDKGDCIDCYLCVDVCPTGIDIRNGIQLECVNCTACIDACDEVMDKINKPRGLVRYASLNAIEKKAKFRFTPRMILYTIVLALLISLISFLVATRTDFNINILRTSGMLYQEQPGDMISNLYDINIVNKTFKEANISLKLENVNGEIKIIGSDIFLEPQGINESKFMVLLSKDEIKKMNTPIELGVYSDDKLIAKLNSTFMGPVKQSQQ